MISYFHPVLQALGKVGIKDCKLTRKAVLHLHNLVSLGILRRKCRVEVQVLLDDIKQVVPRHVVDCFAARDGQRLALHPKDRLAIGEFDVEAVAGDGEDLFLQHEGLTLTRRQLREDADRISGLRQGVDCWGSHGAYLVCFCWRDISGSF